jgi:glycosyltransferase involved in cell wall biosynthesis
MNNYIYLGNYCLTENFQTAGGKRVLNQISFLRKAADVFIISFSPSGSNLDFHKNYKVEDNRGIKFKAQLILYWIPILYLIVKRKKWKSQNVLLLQSSVFITTVVPMLFAKIIGYKVVFDIVEDVTLEVEVSKNKRLTLWMNSFFMRHLQSYCNGLLVISENLLDKFKGYKIPIIKLYNSVESVAKPIDCESNPTVFNFFYAGTFAEKDGVLDLIQAFELVLSKHQNIRLTLVGKGKGNYFESCLAIINNSYLIDYLGYVSEEKMFEEMKRSQVLCVTRSNSEFANNGFPFKLAEYMTFGIPIIATAVSDIPQLLTDGDTIYLAEPSNSTSIASKMNLIIENYTTAVAVGKRGQSYGKNNFSIDCVGAKLDTFLNTI